MDRGSIPFARFRWKRKSLSASDSVYILRLTSIELKNDIAGATRRQYV
jgi:hypothetical protein